MPTTLIGSPVELRDALAKYAMAGMVLFPCRAKKPLIAGGFKSASNSAAAIAEWWRKWPDAQIGLPTGIANKLFVLDVDSAEAATFVEKLDLPETLTVQTSPGRFQFWFEQPLGITTKCTAGVLAPGLDPRGDGGFVVAPPSVHHATGQPYRVVKDLPWAPMPQVLVDLFSAAEPPPPPERTGLRLPPGMNLGAELAKKGLKFNVRTHDGATYYDYHGLAGEDGKPQPCLIQGTPHPANLTNSRCSTFVERDGRFWHWCFDSDCRSAPEPKTRKACAALGLEVSLGAQAVIECVADVPTQQISWLWPGKFPLGKLALLAGDPGLGKSVLTLDLAARVSTGRAWPDGSPCERGSVVVLSAEDDVADTIRPRLEAAGANLTKVHVLRAVRRARPTGGTVLQPFSLQSDIAALQETIASVENTRLIIVDPVSAFLGSSDSHKNAEIRAVLAPLAELANLFKVAVLAVNHLNKSAGPALYRIIGSIAFTAAARAVWIVARSQDNPTERLMLPAKMNLAPDVEGFTFSLKEARPGIVGIVWGHAITVSADVVLGPDTPDARSERAEATQWLRQRLADGPAPVTKLQTEAKAAGFSWMTVRRAKDALGADSMKESLGSGWYWALPHARAEDAQPPPPLISEHLRTFEGAHTPEGAHQGAHQIESRAPSTKYKKEEVVSSSSTTKVLTATGVGDDGFVRDPGGHGCTCTTCGGHFGTFAGWRAHALRRRCYKASGAVQ